MLTPDNFSDEPSGRFGPESSGYIGLNEPYNDRLVQFTALNGLGYPVEIEVLGHKDLPFGDSPGMRKPDEYTQWEIDNFNSWIRPIVLDEEFEPFIEDPDAPGGLEDIIGEERNKLLRNHPMQLASMADYNSPNEVAHTIARLRNGSISFDWKITRDEDLQTDLRSGALIEQVFMTSFARYLNKMNSDYPFSPGSNRLSLSRHHPDQAAAKLYYDLISVGRKPVSPRVLGRLMTHYYQRLERISPEFAKFKA